MFKLLPFFILGIIGAEIVVFVAAVKLFGGLAVVSATLVTGIAGAMLLRRQGLKALAALASGPNQDRSGAIQSMMSGTWLAVAGLLLIFPGFIADFLGILLTIGPVRRFLTKRLGRWFSIRSSSMSYTQTWKKESTVIEGEAVEMPSESDEKRPLIR